MYFIIVFVSHILIAGEVQRFFVCLNPLFVFLLLLCDCSSHILLLGLVGFVMYKDYFIFQGH